jgi:hypothetical protein
MSIKGSSPNIKDSFTSITEKLGLKPRRSTTAFFQLISVPIYYTSNSGKVVNHLKNLAVERQSTEP